MIDKDIIVPSWNNEKFTIECFKSIKEHTQNYRLIWVDNGSTQESKDAVNEVIKDMPHIKIFNETNLGFVKATNQGLAVSSAKNIFLVNNDTVMTPRWAEKMISKSYDIVGPITSPCKSWQSCTNLVSHWGIPQYFGSVLAYNELLENIYKDKGKEVKGMVAFFCTLIRRPVFEKIGFLSEDFGLGLGDDDWFCLKATEAGFKIGIALDTFIFHNHRTTFKSAFSEEELKRMERAGLQKFFEKRDANIRSQSVKRKNRRKREVEESDLYTILRNPIA